MLFPGTHGAVHSTEILNPKPCLSQREGFGLKVYLNYKCTETLTKPNLYRILFEQTGSIYSFSQVSQTSCFYFIYWCFIWPYVWINSQKSGAICCQLSGIESSCVTATPDTCEECLYKRRIEGRSRLIQNDCFLFMFYLCPMRSKVIQRDHLTPVWVKSKKSSWWHWNATHHAQEAELCDACCLPDQVWNFYFALFLTLWTYFCFMMHWKVNMWLWRLSVFTIK